ncbi:MAG: DUF1016 N-terminal domain-containing protein [Hormoscilla sp.]
MVQLYNSVNPDSLLGRSKRPGAVNRSHVLLYWHMGAQIRSTASRSRLGREGAIEPYSRDLRQEFPQVKGLSLRNLKYMRAFAVLNDSLNDIVR